MRNVQALAMLLVASTGFMTLPSSLNAQVLFEEDFESGQFSQGASPRWSWPGEPTNSGNIQSAMLRGEGDVYSITTARRYRGDYAMAMDFSGRNNWCNTCGNTELSLNATTASTGCFTVPEPGPYGDSVYNRDNGFSQWEVTSVTGQQVCIDVSRAIGDSIFGSAQTGLSAGDLVRVPKRCGVNGDVSNSVSRRIDCNRAITYLNGVSTNDIGYGERIARRFYMLIPRQTQLPNITFKLGYSFWQRVGEQSRVSTLKLSVQRDTSLELLAPNGERISGRSNTVPRDQWWYFEEVWVRESSAGARDAEYRVYMGPADAPTAQLVQPVVVRSGFEMGELRQMSINGNWQHTGGVSGLVYFDDIVIAKQFVGPVGADLDSVPAAAVDDLN